jgi:D-glycero-D-manno-heptose 1,7-bisphosphate phosphatase
MNLQTKKMVILDRDGVINYDSDEFVKTPDEWLPIPGSLAAIKKLNDAGIIVAVASNQSGVGRGLFSEATLQKIHQKFTDLLAELGGHIDQIEYCPHAPDVDCACRKPKPGMVNKLLKQFNMQPQDVLVVGDRLRDLESGLVVGCAAALVKTGKGEREIAKHKIPAPVFADLQAVVDAMVGHE